MDPGIRVREVMRSGKHKPVESSGRKFFQDALIGASGNAIRAIPFGYVYPIGPAKQFAQPGRWSLDLKGFVLFADKLADLIDSVELLPIGHEFDQRDHLSFPWFVILFHPDRQAVKSRGNGQRVEVFSLQIPTIHQAGQVKYSDGVVFIALKMTAQFFPEWRKDIFDF